MADVHQIFTLYPIKSPFQRRAGSLLIFTFILSVFPFINPPQSSASLIEIGDGEISVNISQPLSSFPSGFEQSIPNISFKLSIQDVNLFSFTPSDLNSDTLFTFDQLSPSFDVAATLLTNNINESIGYGLYTPVAKLVYGTSEAMLFYDDDTGQSGIDFSGFHIDSLNLSVTSFLAETYEKDSGAIWFKASANLTFSIYGSQETAPVPEPATALLMGTGFTILALRRRKLNK
ncbi:MAG: PEP-CTERM sorting domain-containing protein [Desulfobulbaceae bacterium]|nr:PEP-CTERM sorting domain-containing protein [Desulfobulbaceae bacterium]